MTTSTDTTEYLFSYGTLQLDAVQQANFGRLLSGRRDVLPRFEQGLIEISDETIVQLSGKSHHAIARYTGRASDSIAGTVYALTPAEVQRADAYEVEPYTRAKVTLQSGTRAWVYVDAEFMPPEET